MINNASNINKMDNHISPQIIKYKRTTTYDVGDPGLDLKQTQKCGGVKLVNRFTGPH